MRLFPSFTHASLIGNDDSARAKAAHVLRRLDPNCLITEGQSLATTLATDATQAGGLIVLLDPQPGDMTQAVDALDAEGLPRWAIVARTAQDQAPEPAPSAVCVAAAHWDDTSLENAFRSSHQLLKVVRENARLRGDMRTLSRRYSHDLRTPLNCVSTASDALRSPDDDANAASAIFLQSITSSIDDVSRLLERVGFVLKASADPVALQPVAMGDIVWAATQRLNFRLMKQGVKIVTPEQWPVVHGVASWLEVVWGNLLANSLQHAGDIREIQVGWDQAENSCRFWVRDAGRGVAADKRKGLFHPFHQLNNLNAPRGFGLPITRRLVELQGGECGYLPEPSPGGTFYFTLPLAANL